ncbi:MAG TPA: glycosyltransferase family 9 protein, partial [Terriglobia bacterium]
MAKRLQPDQLGDARILVRVPNWVGDTMMCLPALRALRHALPRAALTLLARPWVRDVIPIEELGCRLISYDTQGSHRGWRGRMSLVSALREERFDAAVLFQNAFDAALVALLARIPIRAGYSRHWRKPLLTHAVAVPRHGDTPAHEAHYYLEMLHRLGLIAGYDEVRQVLLPTSEAVRRGARADLQERLEGTFPLPKTGTGPFVGISPGATFGTAKRWPVARFAELASRLTKELGAHCIFFGAPQEKPLADEVQSQAGVP